MEEYKSFSHLPLTELFQEEGFACKCGKHHHTDVKEVSIGHGVLEQIPTIVQKFGGTKPFLLSDHNTHRAAGEKVETLLKEYGMEFTSYVFPQDHLEPDEFPVGQAAMNFDRSCDFIIAIGSGTINDISKMLSKVTGLKYMIVGTAPSMDGFASNTSSMISAGIKVSIYTACPVAILADLDVVCQAPMKMLQAGLGDMLAKYISICEWRISHLVNGEYYCEEIASLVRRSLKKCVESADGLAKRDPKAIGNILEGLVLSGMAMGFAGVSRPASGVEHYFSHVWDMRSLEFHTNSDLHGIQVGIGTVLALKAYEQVRAIQPDRTRALEYVNSFDHEAHNAFLQEYLGSSAADLILLEKKEGKYDKAKHAKRLEVILDHWQDILNIINEELPALSDVRDLLTSLGAPVNPEALGFDREEVRKTFTVTKDIRDKYSASRLLWDIGELETVAERL
jgi:glycerol-1-phosphate dehydrogenase [NAD(P)+]